MKQILQNLGNGDTMMVEVPAPVPSSGKVLIETSRTLVSLGTEKMLIDFGKGSLLPKARQQPEKVKEVLRKVLARTRHHTSRGLIGCGFLRHSMY